MPKAGTFKVQRIPLDLFRLTAWVLDPGSTRWGAADLHVVMWEASGYQEEPDEVLSDGSDTTRCLSGMKGGSGGEPGHTGRTTSPSLSASVWGFPWRLLGRGKIGLLCLGYWPRDLPLVKRQKTDGWMDSVAEQ